MIIRRDLLRMNNLKNVRLNFLRVHRLSRHIGLFAVSLAKTSIKQKMLMVVGLLVCLSIAVMALGLHGVHSANESLKNAYSRRIVPIKELKIVADNYAVNIIDTAHKVRNGNMTWPMADERLNAASKAIGEHWAAYRSQTLSDEERQQVNKIELQFEIANAELENLKTVIANQDKDALASFMINVMYSSIEPISVQISELIDLELQLAREEYEQAQERYIAQLAAFLLLMAVGLISSAGLALWVIRLMLSQIREMVCAVEQVADGMLQIDQVHVVTEDEIGRLGIAINTMVSTLRDLVGQVRASSEQVAAKADETAASISEVNGTVQELVSNSDRLSNDALIGNESILSASQSLVELSSLIEIAKLRAASAVEGASATNEAALRGRKMVADTAGLMAQIQTKTQETEESVRTLELYTRKIATINETITQIAAQTNLLALNAAIEAARAGEAGKGFAVVAREVTILAEQSKNGARQVSELVRQIVQSTAAAVAVLRESSQMVEDGVNSVKAADMALEHIVKTVNSSTTAIQGVLAVTQEDVAQSDLIIELIDSLATVIENTANSANSVAEVAQQTSAVMKELAISSKESSDLAGELKQAVGFFQAG